MFKNFIFKLKQDVVARDLFFLLMIGGLYSIGIFLSNTFVNIYLWRQSNDFQIIAIYNLSIIIFQVIAFMISGGLAKKVDRIIVLRLGVIFLSLFFMLVLMLGESASHFNILLGALLGIGYGCYWLAFNVLTFEVTEPDTRDMFNGVMGALESFAGMFGPLVAGFIIAKFITNIGYIIIFTISFIFFILAVVGSFFLSRRKARGKYNVFFVLKEFLHNKSWRAILIANFFQGLREGIFVFLISILLFITTNDEFIIGLYNFVLCGFSLLVYLIVTKILKYKWRINAILIGALLLSGSVYIIVFNQSISTFLIYAAVVGMALPILNIPFNSFSYDVIGQSKSIHNFRVEYIVVLELFTNLGRLISISSFVMGLFYYNSINFIITLLIVYSPAYIFIYFFLKNIQQNQKQI